MREKRKPCNPATLLRAKKLEKWAVGEMGMRLVSWGRWLVWVLLGVLVGMVLGVVARMVWWLMCWWCGDGVGWGCFGMVWGWGDW